MSHMFLKSAQGAAVANGADAGAVVAEMLARIEREGEAAVIDYAARLDRAHRRPRGADRRGGGRA